MQEISHQKKIEANFFFQMLEEKKYQPRIEYLLKIYAIVRNKRKIKALSDWGKWKDFYHHKMYFRREFSKQEWNNKWRHFEILRRGKKEWKWVSTSAFLPIFSLEIELLYNVVLVSAILHHSSAVCINVSPPPPFHPLGQHRALSWPPCAIQYLLTS